MEETKETNQPEMVTPKSMPQTVNDKPVSKSEKTIPMKTERSFKTLEQIYSNPKKKTYSLQFLRTADQFDRKVVHDQINQSPAKFQFTFPKANRFSKPRMSYCTTQFYESQLRSQLGSRSAAIGFGTKSDFTKKDKYIPPPTAYTATRPQSRGVKFAFGRDETFKQGLLGLMNKNPGPADYNPLKKNDAQKYTFGERTKAKHIYLVNTNPPPGSYEINGLDAKGSYFLTKYRSSGATVISPASAQSVRMKRYPGPGTYDPPGDVGDRKQHLPSKYLNQSGFKFSIGERKTQALRNPQCKFFILKLKKKDPGPGSYQLPSEFGDFEYPPL